MTCYNDHLFVEFLIQNLLAELKIDPNRIHVSGLSNGAQGRTMSFDRNISKVTTHSLHSFYNYNWLSKTRLGSSTSFLTFLPPTPASSSPPSGLYLEFPSLGTAHCPGTRLQWLTSMELWTTWSPSLWTPWWGVMALDLRERSPQSSLTTGCTIMRNPSTSNIWVSHPDMSRNPLLSWQSGGLAARLESRTRQRWMGWMTGSVSGQSLSLSPADLSAPVTTVRSPSWCSALESTVTSTPGTTTTWQPPGSCGTSWRILTPLSRNSLSRLYAVPTPRWQWKWRKNSYNVINGVSCNTFMIDRRLVREGDVSMGRCTLGLVL